MGRTGAIPIFEKKSIFGSALGGGFFFTSSKSPKIGVSSTAAVWASAAGASLAAWDDDEPLAGTDTTDTAAQTIRDRHTPVANGTASSDQHTLNERLRCDVLIEISGYTDAADADRRGGGNRWRSGLGRSRLNRWGK